MSVRRSLFVSISMAIALLSPGAAVAGGTVVDFIDPVVTLTTPPDNAFYNLNQTVLADFSCSDNQPGDSGIASCNGEVLNGDAIDTSSLGQHLFTVSATDNQGNFASKTHLYTVVNGEGKPDVRIRRIGRTTLVGNNIYSQSAAGEELGASLKAPGIRRFVITIQNDGTDPDSYTLMAAGGGGVVPGYDIKYYHGWPATDITTAMFNGTYQTPTIQPGKIFRIRAVVTIGVAPTQPGISNLIRATSNNNATVLDAVRFTIGTLPPD